MRMLRGDIKFRSCLCESRIHPIRVCTCRENSPSKTKYVRINQITTFYAMKDVETIAWDRDQFSNIDIGSIAEIMFSS